MLKDKNKPPVIEKCRACGKPSHKCYCLECFDSDCDGMAPFIRENKKHDCLHRCKKCGDAFWIREDGDIDYAE